MKWFFILTLLCFGAYGADQLIHQEDVPWWDKYLFEILTVLGTSFSGYVAGQHWRSVSDTGAAFINGAVTGVLTTWVFTNKYTLNESLQAGVLLAFCAPIVVMICLFIIDKLFPGKGNVIRSGVYVDDADGDMTRRVKGMAAAAIVGKRKRKPRDPKDVWTDEERKERR